ncbi:MAG: HNH endonuclease, partial [Cyanobacteria bacterium P01_H01_bin.26]
DYKKYDHWRYINGDSKRGTTPKSKQWVRENSDRCCPVCGQSFSHRDGPTIDHKLPRAQYPWLSLDFRNLWVICYICNQEKGERHWYEYERYMLINHPERYQDIIVFRPRQLLKDL